MSFKNVFIYFYPISIAGGVYFGSHFATAEAAAEWMLLKCPFHFLTGLLCPTCGITRSILALFQGELLVALEFHPLGPILFFASFCLWLLLLFNFDFLSRLYKAYLAVPLFKLATQAAVASYVIWGIFRNL